MSLLRTNFFTALFIIIFSIGCVPQLQPVERSPQFSNEPLISPQEPHTFVSPFQDVPIPQDLKEVPKETLIMENQGVRTGMATYWSRIPLASLNVFFRGELKTNGWEQTVAFTSEPCTTLLFKKNELWCLILLENHGATDVRIGVSRNASFIR